MTSKVDLGLHTHTGLCLHIYEHIHSYKNRQSYKILILYIRPLLEGKNRELKGHSSGMSKSQSKMIKETRSHTLISKQTEIM